MNKLQKHALALVRERRLYPFRGQVVFDQRGARLSTHHKWLPLSDVVANSLLQQGEAEDAIAGYDNTQCLELIRGIATPGEQIIVLLEQKEFIA